MSDQPDLVALFPWLAEHAATAIRLNPAPSASPLAPAASKIGGRFLWPAEVAWPVCTARETAPVPSEEEFGALAALWEGAHPGEDAAALVQRFAEHARALRQQHHESYRPLVQLRRDEFPTFPFPGEADIFQLFWCPQPHIATPAHIAIWRREKDAGSIASRQVEAPEHGLAPEPVTEYPMSVEFETSFRRELDEKLTGAAMRVTAGGVRRLMTGSQYYDDTLSVVRGSKLFGYVRWKSDPGNARCDCGRPMGLLLTVSAEEASQDLLVFWCPVCPGPKLRSYVQTL